MIQVENLFKKYPSAEFPSVDGLSFSFEKGKIVGLLGPNGAGKTTTISILSGLVTQFSGRVSVLDRDIRTNAAYLKHQIGVVPQQIALYPTLSCLENLHYYANLYRLPSSVYLVKVRNLLQQFGLEQHADKQIRHFSGGMKRRANIIASLLNDPTLLILDEPTAGVDVQSRNMILSFLKEYNRQGHSILYTSHLLEEAESLCEEVLIIDQGKKIIQGEPKALARAHGAENLEALFLMLTGHNVRD